MKLHNRIYRASSIAFGVACVFILRSPCIIAIPMACLCRWAEGKSEDFLDWLDARAPSVNDYRDSNRDGTDGWRWVTRKEKKAAQEEAERHWRKFLDIICYPEEEEQK
jgi:hypothetical protein